MTRERTSDRTRRPLLRLIASIAHAIEVRDPYTAEHQRRVAELSRRIGREMGLPSGQVETIRIGATLHDIGKVAIPSSLLTKPSRLNQHEIGLIRTHAEVGHSILARAKLPWPVASILYQHHERVDGSGYPLGLAGNAITLAARIVAVADVYDAMAYDRPYRKSGGPAAARAELSDNRGKAYDDEVVTACLAVLERDPAAFET